MDAIRVISPEGNGVVVSEVVFGGPPESWIATTEGIERGEGAYASLEDALRRNNRSTTFADRIQVKNAAEVTALLGKPPT